MLSFAFATPVKLYFSVAFKLLPYVVLAFGTVCFYVRGKFSKLPDDYSRTGYILRQIRFPVFVRKIRS